MEIFQGSISTEYKCRPFTENNKLTGLLFYKDRSSPAEYAIIFAVLVASLFVWYKSNFGTFILFLLIAFACNLIYIFQLRNDHERNGIKYLIKDITEVKILDNDTTTSYEKSAVGSLTGAAVGGILLGGAGAVVGAIASGNQQNKEQIIRVGIKFGDSNWVVLQTLIDDTSTGKVNRLNLSALLEMTSSKQFAPF